MRIFFEKKKIVGVLLIGWDVPPEINGKLIFGFLFDVNGWTAVQKKVSIRKGLIKLSKRQ